jgi:hypothetical protein
LGKVEKLSDQQVAPEQGAVEVVAGAEGVDRVSTAEDLAAQAAIQQVATKERTGILGILKRLQPEKSAETAAAEIVLAGLVEDSAPIAEGAPVEEVEAPAEPVENAAESIDRPRRMPGLFGLLGRDQARSDPIGQMTAEPVSPKTENPAQNGAPHRRVASAGPDKDVVPGTVMAFGNIGRVCDQKRGDMGRRVAQYPDRGVKYRIFDRAPDSMNSRTFFITGFDDGCARQITGAMVMFGDVEMHESLRYGTAASIQPRNDIDKAYNRVKARVCKVGKNKPCGDRINTLQRDTVFLSVYETFGQGGRWNNILLHDGQVEAAAMGAKP